LKIIKKNFFDFILKIQVESSKNNSTFPKFRIFFIHNKYDSDDFDFLGYDLVEKLDKINTEQNDDAIIDDKKDDIIIEGKDDVIVEDVEDVEDNVIVDDINITNRHR
jgi:hypothetical protein